MIFVLHMLGLRWHHGPCLEIFNMIRFMEERQGCVANLNGSDSFNDLIQELTLIDILLWGRSFTWSNKRDTPAFAKLD